MHFNKFLLYLPFMDIALQRIQSYDPKESVKLDLSHLGLKHLPQLPHFIFEFNCSHNELTELPVLPSTLQILTCTHNNLTKIENLPRYLIDLECSYNQIKDIDLPIGLQRLICHHNKIEKLDLPYMLESLNCCYNNLIKLEGTPLLDLLVCSDNKLVSVKLHREPAYYYALDNPYLTIDKEAGKRFNFSTPDYHKTMQPIKQMYRAIHNPDIKYAPEGKYYKEMQLKYQGVFSDL
jgi:hypothetical protein